MPATPRTPSRVCLKEFRPPSSVKPRKWLREHSKTVPKELIPLLDEITALSRARRNPPWDALSARETQLRVKVGERLRADREARGIDHNRLALHCGMNPNTMCRIEGGAHTLSLATRISALYLAMSRSPVALLTARARRAHYEWWRDQPEPEPELDLR